MGAVIGIDLGTTNTVVAAVRDGRAVALPDESGATLIPSIVSFLPSGSVLVGNAARERRAEDVRNTIYSVKRLIGRTWDSSEVTLARTRFPFELREGPGRATFVIARGETYTLAEISAFVLRKAKSIAELELGEPVDRAVITVPANFNDLQRAATKVAGRVAGLEVLRIINEPTAAALAFGHTTGKTKHLAVYDFGGGTFDFTLLRLTTDVFEVLATAGNTFLGGDDVDAEIVERIADRFIAEEKADPRETPDGLERVRSAAEQLKIALSTEPDASIRLDELGISDSPGVGFLLTRRDLDSIMRPIIEKTFAVCRDALGSAGLSTKDIDDVLLVGGSTKDGYVRKRVGEFFGKPARHDVDPHEVVALGAAQQAAMLTRTNATAEGVDVPPPPLPVTRSSSTDEAQEQDFRQKTQPFGRSAPVQQRPNRESFTLEPTPSSPFLSAPEDLPAPAKFNTSPKEGPVSNPVPTTRDFARRDRRTTGMGLGPGNAPVPAAALPLVGLGAHAPVQPRPTTPTLIDATHPPNTLSGLGQTGQRAFDDGTARADAELPAPKPAAPLQFTRGPAMRVPAGSGPTKKPDVDLSDTLTSALVRPDPSKVHEASPKPIAPAFQSAEPKGPQTYPFGSAIINPVNRGTAPFAPSTVTADLPMNVDSTSDWEPLPALVESKPQTPRLSLPRSDTPLTAERPVALHEETGNDEPTVVRRSLAELDFLAQETTELPESLDPLNLTANVASRAGRPVSLNEEEIRARYGNLPLIVGGRRVGTASTMPRAEPLSPNAPPSVHAPQPPPVPVLAKGPERPAPAIGTIPRQLTQVLPPEANIPGGRPLSLEPDALEPELEALEFEPDGAESRSSRPAPGRFMSSHPAGRQDPTLEAKLPLPDLPPTSSSRAPLGSSPLSTTTGHTVPSRLDATATSARAVSGRTTLTNDVVRSDVHSLTQTAVIKPTGTPQNLPPPRNIAPANLGRTVALAAPQSPIGDLSAIPGRVPTQTVAMPVAIPAASFDNASVTAGFALGTTAASLSQSPASSSRRPPSPALLIDVTPLSLCVETAGGYTDVLVARNTPVPCERTRDFVTIQDNQESVIVRIAQGESQQFQENVLLGEVQLSKLTLAPRGQARISVTFGLDSDGMLHVRALDVATGQSAIAELQLVATPTSPEVKQMVARQKTKGNLGGHA